MKTETKPKVSPERRALLSQWGAKGGRAGSREAKQAAGRKGYQAMMRKALQQSQNQT